MTMDKDPETPEAPAREPYERPQVVESGRFEHLVLMCLKGPSNPVPECTSNFPVSWTS